MSSPEHYSKCACQHCGGRIEFPSHGAGRLTQCPHCQRPTILGGLPVASTPQKKKTSPIYLILLILAVAAAGGATYYFLARNKESAASAPPVVVQPVPAATSAPPAPEPLPDPWHGLVAGPVQLENGKDGHLVYAVGTLKNTTDKQRFGVKVKLDVFDVDGGKIGAASDYAQTIEPSNEWRFKALVIDRKAKSAKVASVTED